MANIHGRVGKFQKLFLAPVVRFWAGWTNQAVEITESGHAAHRTLKVHFDFANCF
jgi:hypothetical protein